MAGRGRAHKTSSFTQDQLQTLGVLGKDKDLTPVQAVPPPTFPQLLTKPVTLETTVAQNYQMLWREGFLNHMQTSPYFLVPKQAKKRDFRGQAFAGVEPNVKAKPDFNWELMPSELQPIRRKKTVVLSKRDVIKPKANIEDFLKKLEEKERTEDETEPQVKNNSESEIEEGEETPIDDEMDDENDYGNSYFDNGEAYNEEDDNLDDGPIY